MNVLLALCHCAMNELLAMGHPAGIENFSCCIQICIKNYVKKNVEPRVNAEPYMMT
jgi:hypothetical protein